jgi:hypothetical protein
MYIITARRITSGELLKQRNGFSIERAYGSPLPASSRFSLTMPQKVLIGYRQQSGYHLNERHFE